MFHKLDNFYNKVVTNLDNFFDKTVNSLKLVFRRHFR